MEETDGDVCTDAEHPLLVKIVELVRHPQRSKKWGSRDRCDRGTVLVLITSFLVDHLRCPLTLRLRPCYPQKTVRLSSSPQSQESLRGIGSIQIRKILTSPDGRHEQIIGINYVFRTRHRKPTHTLRPRVTTPDSVGN